MARPEIVIENQVFRFITPETLDPDYIVNEIGAVRSGGLLIKQLSAPPYTILIDVHNSSITIHG